MKNSQNAKIILPVFANQLFCGTPSTPSQYITLPWPSLPVCTEPEGQPDVKA